MVLVELPVTFKDLKQMMEIFQKEDSNIGTNIVDVQGNYLVLNPPFNDAKTTKEG